MTRTAQLRAGRTSSATGRRQPARRRRLSAAASLLAGLAVVGCCTARTAASIAPVASAGSYETEPATSVSIALEADDANGDPLDYIITTLPTKGSLAADGATLAAGNLPYTIADTGDLTYTPTSTAHGTDTFQFKASDGTVDSAAATISIVVNLPPVVGTTEFATIPNKDLSIAIPVSDPDKDTLSYTITSLPGHGRLKVGATILTDTVIPYTTSQATITYSPDQDYHGQDHFHLTATDGYATVDPVTLGIEVNSTPVPIGVSVTVLPGGSQTIQLTATDADKDPVQYIIVSLPTHGTLSIGETIIEEAQLPEMLDPDVDTVIYSVESEYLGTDSFHFRVTDQGGVSTSDRAVVTIAVDTPPAACDSTVLGTRGSTVTGQLAPTDADGDALTIQLTTLPESGTLKINGIAASLTATYQAATGPIPFTFTPPADAAGGFSFTWIANDGREDSGPAQVSISIIGTSPPPASGGDDTDPSSDDSTDNGSSESSSDAGAGCGSFGAAEAIIMAMGLLFVPGRVFRLRFPRQ
jgi:large repetitive protein